MSLDALSSVAYGPEAIVLGLVAAGAAAVSWTVPISLAIALLLLVLRVIDAEDDLDDNHDDDRHHDDDDHDEHDQHDPSARQRRHPCGWRRRWRWRPAGGGPAAARPTTITQTLTLR